MSEEIQSVEDFANQVKTFSTEILSEVSKVIVGKRETLELLLVALLAGGHVLLEGVPGVAKTFMARTFAGVMKLDFKRVQFTPDLLPSDIVGSMIYNQKEGKFSFNPGPIFTNILLADEINRAPPKTQSALLEAMAERSVSIEGTTHKLDRPFTVFATQNPVEQEGTYILPEAQLDRFLFKLNVSYPEKDEDIEILNRKLGLKDIDEIKVEVKTTKEAVRDIQDKIINIYVDQRMLEYIAELVNKARKHPYVQFGASPRASIALMIASRPYAAMRGRPYVEPDDIKALYKPILNHRLALTPEAELAGYSSEQILDEILKSTEVPYFDPNELPVLQQETAVT